jgi:hypothetical protein
MFMITHSMHRPKPTRYDQGFREVRWAPIPTIVESSSGNQSYSSPDDRDLNWASYVLFHPIIGNKCCYLGRNQGKTQYAG